jgi:hypothetical protein
LHQWNRRRGGSSFGRFAARRRLSSTAIPLGPPWSDKTLERVADEAVLVINPIVYGELSLGFASIEDLDSALEPHLVEREGPSFCSVERCRRSRLGEDL